MQQPELSILFLGSQEAILSELERCISPIRLNLLKHQLKLWTYMFAVIKCRGVLCPVKTEQGLELELYKNLMHMVVLECSFMTVTFFCNLRACSDCNSGPKCNMYAVLFYLRDIWFSRVQAGYMKCKTNRVPEYICVDNSKALISECLYATA